MGSYIYVVTKKYVDTDLGKVFGSRFAYKPYSEDYDNCPRSKANRRMYNLYAAPTARAVKRAGFSPELITIGDAVAGEYVYRVNNQLDFCDDSLSMKKPVGKLVKRGELYSIEEV